MSTLHLSRRWSSLRRFGVSLALIGMLSACGGTPDTPTPMPQNTPVAVQATATTAAVQPTPESPAVDPAPTVESPRTDDADSTWLVMIYADADDEILERDIVTDINEAELVGSSEQVTIVAQVDRFKGAYDGDGDWTTTKRFLISQDQDMETLGSEELADLGEVNMADGATLVDFVTWAAQTYPADNYVLILEDHGAGWPGGWNDPDPPVEPPQDTPLGQAFGDMLYLNELDQALATIQAQTGIAQFEFVGFDACLMGQLEVFTTLAPYARYAVASEESEPALGWAYSAWLQALVDDPGMQTAQLVSTIVDSYISQDGRIINDQARRTFVEESYQVSEDPGPELIAEHLVQNITLTAVDLSMLPPVLGALDELVTVLSQVDQRQIAKAARYAHAFDTVFDKEQPKPFIDLGHFTQLVKATVHDPAVSAAADQLLAAMGQAIVAEKHGPKQDGATGIAIHFPNSDLYQDPAAGYESYAITADRFARESLWDDYLAFHYTGQALPASDAQPPAAQVGAVVNAPGAQEIQIADIVLSADIATLDQPVTLQSEVSSDGLAYLYLFVGQINEDQSAIRIVDMDFIPAKNTKEIDGVFFPDWGEGGTLPVEFEWAPILFTISDGTNTVEALLEPDEYGASPEETTYTVEGIYTFAGSNEQRYAILVMSNGELIQVLGFSDEDETGAIHEITPQAGDTFTILEQWIPLAEDEEEIIVQEGGTLVFGEQNVVWQEVVAPAGEYVLGLIAEDLDGNLYESFTVVTVQ